MHRRTRTLPGTHSHCSLRATRSVPKILVAQADPKVFAAQELDDGLQIIPLFPGDPDLAVHQLALNLKVQTLDGLVDFLSLVPVQSLLDMEFLARIDHRSVTWVFRAANLNEYHLATIASTAAGGYEFGRGTVIGGVSDLAATTPIPVVLNRKTAVTIRLRAVGNEFSVWLEGQLIDTWSDGRLQAGGIGFMGAPDDRARIYWVRLSPPGSAGKEYARR